MSNVTLHPIKKRRVVVQERGFGRYTIEVGQLVFPLTGFITLDLTVPIIGFGWPGFSPGYHILN